MFEKHNPRTDLDRAMDVIRRDYPFLCQLERAFRYNPEATTQIIRDLLKVFVVRRHPDNRQHRVDPEVAKRLTPELLRQIKEQLDGNRHNFMEELEYLFLQMAAETMFPRVPLAIQIPDDLLESECAHHDGCCLQADQPCTVIDCAHPCERAQIPANTKPPTPTTAPDAAGGQETP